RFGTGGSGRAEDLHGPVFQQAGGQGGGEHPSAAVAEGVGQEAGHGGGRVVGVAPGDRGTPDVQGPGPVGGRWSGVLVEDVQRVVGVVAADDQPSRGGFGDPAPGAEQGRFGQGVDAVAQRVGGVGGTGDGGSAGQRAQHPGVTDPVAGVGGERDAVAGGGGGERQRVDERAELAVFDEDAGQSGVGVVPAQPRGRQGVDGRQRQVADRGAGGPFEAGGGGGAAGEAGVGGGPAQPRGRQGVGGRQRQVADRVVVGPFEDGDVGAAGAALLLREEQPRPGGGEEAVALFDRGVHVDGEEHRSG